MQNTVDHLYAPSDQSRKPICGDCLVNLHNVAAGVLGATPVELASDAIAALNRSYTARNLGRQIVPTREGHCCFCGVTAEAVA